MSSAVISEAKRTTNVVREMLRAARPAARCTRSCPCSPSSPTCSASSSPSRARDTSSSSARRLTRLPPVRGQGGRLEQVILNLVVNAMQAIEEHAQSGAIGLRITADAAAVWLAVEDSGPGLPAELSSQIFDRFFTTKPVGKGTGLGLWIARQIVSEHGGEITAANRPSGGACLTIRLPRCNVAAAPSSRVRDLLEPMAVGSTPWRAVRV